MEITQQRKVVRNNMCLSKATVKNEHANKLKNIFKLTLSSYVAIVRETKCENN